MPFDPFWQAIGIGVASALIVIGLALMCVMMLVASRMRNDAIFTDPCRHRWYKWQRVWNPISIYKQTRVCSLCGHRENVL